MKVVFMGTPALAATVLDALAEAHEVVGVFTRPDAVRGRGKQLVASPVKVAALKRGIPVHEAKSLKGGEAAATVEALAPDAICVAAYGALLPPEVLEIPRHGCLNVHTSLLPRWRGAAPIERAILARDEQAGVCIMRMEEGLDTGPYCLRREIPVNGAYLEQLSARLAELGAHALLDALAAAENGTLAWTAQPETGVTYAAKIQKGELDCAPDDATADIDAKVRASNASHPSRLQLAGRNLAVERVRIVEPGTAGADVALQPGEATFAAKRLLVGARDGMLELERVKPDGKKSMEGRAFAAGVQGLKGARVNWGRA